MQDISYGFEEKRMKIYMQLILAISVFLVVLLPQSVQARGQAQSLEVSPLKIVTSQGCYKFEVELAKTQEEHNIGLMYRHEMADDHGMLFLNQQVRFNSFWMKNTYISLDIIFIRADGTIANIAAGTVPLSLDAIVSVEPVLAVLELTAGQARRMGLRAGDTVFHEIFDNVP